MSLDVARYSNIGGRQENEDATLTVAGKGFWLGAVADGLGGHGGGAIASSEAMRRLGEGLDALKKPSEDAVRQACIDMNAAVLARQTPACRMKTTLAMTLLYDTGTTVYAHIGDSRVYHFRAGKLLYRSLDHSVSQLAVLAGEITEDQIRFHEDRNRVLRVLGSEEPVRPDVTITENNLRDGDALLMCTDGFWEYVLEAEMLETLADTERSRDWLGGMIRILIGRADKTHDNNSAVAVRVRGGMR